MIRNKAIDLKNSKIFVDDSLTEIVRKGAGEILAKALESKIVNFLYRLLVLQTIRGNRGLPGTAILWWSPKKDYENPTCKRIRRR